MLNRKIRHIAKHNNASESVSVKPADRAQKRAFHAYVATGFVLVYMMAVTASTIAMAAVL